MFAALAIFVLVAGGIVGGYLLATSLPEILQRRQRERRLREIADPVPAAATHAGSVVMRPADGAWPTLDRLAARTQGGLWLGTLIEQSGVKTSPGVVVLGSLVLAAGAAGLAHLAVRQLWVLPMAAVVAGALPTLWLVRRRSQRLRKFEELFPEALDLLSRAIRAGHAFQTAMGMVAEELGDPVGPEFKKSFEQQNFGLPLREALDTLTRRVPLIDVRFFVTAVLIQRETGGNLAEILDNLAHVVRERFKVLRQVRVHTAHGRFTGWVLLALPAALALALSFINPEHMRLLFNEPMGQTMLGGAVVMQVLGYVWISRVIKIEV